MIESFTINQINFDSALTGEIDSGNLYKLWINGVGPFAFSIHGMTTLTQTVRGDNKSVTLCLEDNKVIRLITSNGKGQITKLPF